MSVQIVNVLSYSLPLGFVSHDEDTGLSSAVCDQGHPEWADTYLKGWLCVCSVI